MGRAWAILPPERYIPKEQNVLRGTAQGKGALSRSTPVWTGAF
jgi:hypothetical protein